MFQRTHLPLDFLVVCLLCILLLSTGVLAQNAPAPQIATSSNLFRIAGLVVSANTGQPLGRARVILADTKNRRRSQTLITAEDGRFQFEHLPAGKYALSGQRKGFLDAAYEQHGQFSTAIVAGAGLDTENLTLRLPLPAVLSGRVLDESGEPVRGARVMVYREDRQTGISRIVRFSQDVTDDRGSFEIPTLNAGTYFLSASATPWYALHPMAAHPEGSENMPMLVDRSLDVAYPTIYYSDTEDSNEATPIPIRNGDRTQVDIHLSPVPALHLLVRGVPNGPFRMPQLQRRSFDETDYLPIQEIQAISPGLFEVTGIPPGRYQVRPGDSPQGGSSDAPEVDLANNGQELEVPTGQTGASIKVVVNMPAGAKLPEHLGVVLRGKNQRIPLYQELDQQGAAEFQNLAAGDYNFYATTRNRVFWVAQMIVQGNRLPGHTLNVPAGSSLTVSLSLIADPVTVEGFAKRDGKAVAGAMIVLVPKDREGNRDLFRRDQSDLDGSFSLREVVPGTYTVVAIENGWDLDWSEPGVIAHYCMKGHTISVSSRSAGTVPLVDPVEVQPR